MRTYKHENYKTTYNKGKVYLTGLVCLALIFTFGLWTASAAEKAKVLIINSNASVENYSKVQSKFTSTLVEEIVYEIDQKGGQIEQSTINDIISEKDPDIIFCIGSRAFKSAHKITKNKKIVFSSIINWQRLPIGKNAFGVSYELPTGMQLMMYRYFFPKIQKIGVLYSKKFSKEWIKSAVKEGENVGIAVIGKTLKEPEDLDAALKDILPQVDALWLTSDPIVLANKESVMKIIKQCNDLKKPVLAYNDGFVEYGAAISISADISIMGWQAAQIVDDLIAGIKPDERVLNPGGTYITLNPKKIEEYGIDFNEEAMDSVNRIINK